MLKENFDCVFYTADPSPYQIGELEKVCPYVPLSDSTKFEDFLAFLSGSEIVVLDNYFFTTGYQVAIKNRGCKLVCIDDPHGIHYVCDLLISHGFYSEEDFDCDPFTKKCIGIDWAMLRHPFLLPHKDIQRNNDIIVNFGGSDFFRISNHVLNLLLTLKKKCVIEGVIKVILGDTVEIDDSLKPDIQILRNQSALEIANLFDKSKFAILAASTVCLEAISRNLPVVAGFYVENQKKIYNNMKCLGVISPLGCLQDATEDTLLASIKNLHLVNDHYFNPTAIPARFIDVFSRL